MLGILLIVAGVKVASGAWLWALAPDSLLSELPAYVLGRSS